MQTTQNTEDTYVTETVAQDKGLNTKLLPELKAMAAGLGIEGASGMRKAELVKAIGAKQGGSFVTGVASVLNSR